MQPVVEVLLLQLIGEEAVVEKCSIKPRSDCTGGEPHEKNRYQKYR
jgi:hypothetical protein